MAERIVALKATIARLEAENAELLRQRGPMCQEPGCGKTCVHCDRDQLRDRLR